MTTNSNQSNPSRTPLVAALTFLIAVGLPVAAILTAGLRDVEVQPGAIDWILVAGVAVVTIATFALLVPWAQRDPESTGRAAKTGFALSASGLAVSVILFWTMVPVIFGSAGAWLGHTARERSKSGQRLRGLATAAIIIGAFAALGSVAAYIATS
ncbi:MAG TPA: hypothetical protein VMS74_14310 [Acidimicrobiia bacterium]|nr:hypothetical protein [Acidimicrobiia bacterium]